MPLRTELPTTRPLILVTRLPIPPNVGYILPLRWTQPFGPTRTLVLELDWNDFGHFFTLSFSRPNGDLLLIRPLIYGRNCLDGFWHIPELKGISIVPADPMLKGFRTGLLPSSLGIDTFLYYSIEEA